MSITSLINIKGLTGKASQPKGPGTPERDPFAPDFELVVRGGVGAQPFIITDEIKKYISEVTYEDNSDQFNHLTVQLDNQVDDAGGGQVLSLVDSKLFAEGQILEVRMGFGQSLMTIGACDIVKKTPDFPSTGFPTLTIEGYDLLHRCARRRPRGGVSYKGFRDSQVASIIGERNGFDIRSKDPNSYQHIRKTLGIYDRVQNRGISDYEFLKKVAEINGYDLFSRFDPITKRSILFFQPPATLKQREVFTFAYNEGNLGYHSTLLSFTPSMDAFDQASDFEIFVIKDKDTSSSNYKPIERLTLEEQKRLKEIQDRRFTGKMGRDAGKQKGEDDGVMVAFKAFGRSFRFPAHKRFQSEFQARTAIQEFIKRQKQNFITAEGTLVGKEALQARQVHRLEGLGSQFSGKYYFTKVVHKFSKKDGYHIDFSARKVIDDVIVQAPPALVLSENDRRLSRIKHLRGKKVKPITTEEAFGDDD